MPEAKTVAAKATVPKKKDLVAEATALKERILSELPGYPDQVQAGLLRVVDGVRGLENVVAVQGMMQTETQP